MPDPASPFQPHSISGRVRCKGCGSTRVRAIVDAYCDGRITLDAKGRMVVESGDFVVHDEYLISPASVQCENCGGGEARVERAKVALP